MQSAVRNPKSEMPPTIWNNCYDASWKGLIVPEAFAHPAKFSRGLVERIIAHGLTRGWWEQGSTIGDPFGGVALGGIACGYAGLNWVGVELEEKFVTLGCRNLFMHVGTWSKLGTCGGRGVTLLHGDSRDFAGVVRGGGLEAVVTSPPFTVDQPCASQTRGLKDYQAFTRGNGTKRDQAMTSAGNLQTLKAGSINAVLTSPPYAASIHDRNGIDPTKFKQRFGPNTQALGTGYGCTAGQIGALASGAIDAVVTSPPWENRFDGANDKNEPARHSAESLERVKKNYFDYAASGTGGQIQAETGETYWQAVAQVYASCREVLRPGGVMCVVVKDYVKDKKRVPLCDQTLRLLEHVGFEPVERIHAMLVKEIREGCLFSAGGERVTLKEKKSFFRRLTEKKGSPRIDWEEVIVVKKCRSQNDE